MGKVTTKLTGQFPKRIEIKRQVCITGPGYYHRNPEWKHPWQIIQNTKQYSEQYIWSYVKEKNSVHERQIFLHTRCVIWADIWTGAERAIVQKGVSKEYVQ